MLIDNSAGVTRSRSVVIALLVVGATCCLQIGCGSLVNSDAERGTRLLIEAFSKRRLIEPRLSGGFKGGEFKPSDHERSSIKGRELEDAEALITEAGAKGRPGGHLAYARLLLSEERDLPEAANYLLRTLEKEPDNPEAHNDLGVCLILQGKLEDAIDEFGAALKHRADMPEPLFNRGLCYDRLRLKHAANEEFSRLRQVERDETWLDEAARRLDQVAVPAVSQKKRTEIIDELNNALAEDPNKARDLVDRNYEVVRSYFFYDLGPEYLQAGETLEASAPTLSRMEKIGSLAVEMKGDHDIADTVKLIAGLTGPRRSEQLRVFRDYKAALAPFDTRSYEAAQAALEALDKRLRKPGDELFRAKVRYGLARAHYQSRHFTASRKLLEELLPFFKSRGWRNHQAHALDLLGLDYSRLGQDSIAIKCFQESYELFQQMREPVAIPLQYVGVTYWHLGNFDEALEHFGDSTDLLLKQGTRPVDLAYNYLNVADIYRLLGKTELALLFADEALPYSRQANDLNRAAQVLSFKAVEHGRLDQMDLAAGEIDEAVKLLDRIGSADRAYTVPLVLLRAGDVALQRGDITAALQRYTDAESLTSAKEGDPILQLNALRGRAETYAKSGQSDRARADLENAIAIIERYLTNIDERLHRIDFLAASNRVFDQIIELDASEAGRARKAFEYSERSRARGLLDEFAPSQSSAIEPCSLEDAQAALPDGLALLAYSVTSVRTQVFVITRTRFEVAASPVTDVQLERLVNSYVTSIRNNASVDQLSQESGELYSLLVQPVRDRLKGVSEICIVPDKSMQLLPMSALKDSSDRYLIEAFPIVYAPSVSVFIRCLSRAEAGARGHEALLAVGNPKFNKEQFEKMPELEDAVREAEGAAAFYDHPVVLTGANAAEGDVRQALKDCTVAHLASHCLVNQQSPWLTALLLAPEQAKLRAGPAGGTPGESPAPDNGERTGARTADRSPMSTLARRTSVDDPADGLLYLNEVYNLKLPRTRLVVLSACETGLGRYYRGEGIVSLIHPFLAAQVSTVVASLWPVTSRATSQLMIDFHKERRESNMRSAEALRASQVKMIRSGEFAHPYFWASFIVVGGNY